MKPLLGFLVGSSITATFPFFWRVARIPPNQLNYSYTTYTLVAPLYLGAMTALAVHLGNSMGLRRAMLLVSVASPLIVIAIAWGMRAYNFGTTWQWVAYGARLIVKHMLVYNLVIYTLLRALCGPSQ